MKKILFNDKYGLTQAVLEGRKTVTRRIMKLSESQIYGFDNVLKQDWGRGTMQAVAETEARYKVGEVVAIAQPYCDIVHESAELNDLLIAKDGRSEPAFRAGFNNKLFVRADLLPHHIRITGVRVERLQDLPDADCLREGIKQSVIEYEGKKIVQYTYFGEKRTTWYDSPREAFTAMIDRISGKGTWNSNPYVFVYEFELVD